MRHICCLPPFFLWLLAAFLIGCDYHASQSGLKPVEHSGNKKTCCEFQIPQAEASLNQEKQAVQHYIQDSIDFQVDINKDLTFTRQVSVRLTALDVVGAEALQKRVLDFYPENEVIDQVEASITRPDGKVIIIDSKDIHHEELTNNDKIVRKVIIYFSQLTPGCQIDFSYRHHVHKPGPYGLNLHLTPQFMIEQKAITASIRYPKSLPLKWGKRGDFRIKETAKGQNKQLDISLHNIPYMEYEYYMVSCVDVVPLFAISSLQSWEEMGRIDYKEIFKEQAECPQVKTLAESITSPEDSVREKSEKLYTWVAQNVNYQALYFSLYDDLIPHKLEDIIAHGYGDCKDQSFLLHSLLKAVGVKSELAAVNWSNSFRDWPIPTSFQFDHVFLYVPELDVYLNPVDPLSPFGDLDEDLANKRVVIASEKGATRFTPAPTVRNYREEARYALSADGRMEGVNNVSGKGTIGLYMRRFLASEGTAKKKAWDLLYSSSVGGFGQLGQHSEPYNTAEPAEYTGSWYSPRAYNMAERAFIQIPKGLGFVNIATGLRGRLTGDGRKYPFIFGLKDYVWQYDVQLPENYQVTDLPENQSIANKAGRYQSRYQLKGRTLTVHRAFSVKKHVFPASDYKDFETLAYAVIHDSQATLGLQRR